MEEYVTKKEFKKLEETVEDIRDNHLSSIWAAIENVSDQVGNLRWFIIASAGILGIVLGIIQVFGG